MNYNINSTYLYFLTGIYFFVSLVGVFHHELWLDEAQHWLIARDSISILDLIKNTRSEGHPILWNLLLFEISRFTTNPFWMQLFHVFISTFFVFVFLKKAPFNWIFKFLFVFGYFIIFEYNLISRNYNLGILFLFLACSMIDKRKGAFLLLSFYLAIAANTHLMFSIIAIALIFILLFEKLKDKQLLKSQNIIGCLIFLISLILLFIQIKTTNSDWLLSSYENMNVLDKIKPGFTSFFKGLIVLPDCRSLHFWNTNLLINWSKPASAILCVLIYFLPIFLNFKNRKTLYFFYTALIGTQIFFFITQRSATRFHGMTYIIFILALWVDTYFELENYKLKEIVFKLKLYVFGKPIIYTVLIIHFFSGIYAYSMDFIHPFTAVKQTKKYIEENKYNHKEIITIACEGTVLSAYLERKVFFLCNNNYESYCKWDADCFDNLTNKTFWVYLKTTCKTTTRLSLFLTIP